MATNSKKTTKSSTSKKSTSKKTSQSINTSAKKYIKKETKKFMKQHKCFSTFLMILLIIFVGIGGVLYYLGYLDPIIDKYLGKGKKIAEAKPEQAEFIYLIVSEIKDTIM